MIASPMANPRTAAGALADRLRSRISTEGPMPFDEFMEAALYDPADGFFQRHVVGERGDFVTAPHLSPAFGVLVARQLDEMWDLLGRPDPFVVVEAGAGDGTLAGQILEFLPSPARDVLRYVAVERGAAGRAALASLAVIVAESLDEVPAGPTGCVIANELLDNMAFRWVTRDEAGPKEIFVATGDDNEFVLVRRPPSRGDLAGWTEHLRAGQRRLVPEGAMRFVRGAASLFGRNYVWIADYGFTDGEFPEGPHGYRGHRLEADVLTDPGSRDITAGVDFGAVAQAAREAGLTVWGPVRQRDALLALGYGDLIDDARFRQTEAAAAGRALEATRIYSARNRASLLVEPGGLGDFLVLAAGRGVAVPPRSVRQVG
jgi:SAM-dependent MidA family methyltransferase